MHGTIRRVAAVATACVAATSAAIAGAGPAAAAGWYITPGGNFSATSAPWAATDGSTGTQLVCTSLKLTGQLGQGQVPGPVIGNVNGFGAVACKVGPLPVTVAFTGFSWSMTPTTWISSTSTVVGTLGSVGAHVAGSACTFDIGGSTPGGLATVPFSYRNTTHSLTIGGTGATHVWNASCLGLIASGDAIAFGGTFDVEPPQSIVPA
ncbi:hypothetical protein [Actinacidiphila rubida]|uniref:Secreted protein n=1 Tax=Actinacidiphila rubida TaxID=310780 RepID=A0A1H8N8N9_9ACTN|nr:hypothetical protein [Actinacidiphila rubida]SEO25819.1 hypothetical protein SAMN05216267_102170 [Actinacidiphila rubida]